MGSRVFFEFQVLFLANHYKRCGKGANRARSVNVFASVKASFSEFCLDCVHTQLIPARSQAARLIAPSLENRNGKNNNGPSITIVCGCEGWVVTDTLAMGYTFYAPSISTRTCFCLGGRSFASVAGSCFVFEPL